jgi:hypothetical protein
MKEAMKRFLAMVMAFTLIATMMPATGASAATKPKLNKTKATVVVGESTSLAVKNAPRGGIA